MSERGKYIRRYDRNGNPYYINRETGRRVSGEKWQRERARIRSRQEKQALPKPPKPPQPAQSAHQPPTPYPAVPQESPVPPFPPGVSDIGEPLDDEGFLDDDAFAIDGEDDT